ncbi:DMT family transporter [Tabrizicola sp. DMG-N-6]|uniref:DMT family transporter n=2 Tax=Szabonella alba TaxID=2804194 RepID=A0A8K0V9A7_9RHOB|nr:DMT family transporter [Szabonella alba]
MASAFAAAVIFSVNDASIKFLSGGYALHQLVLIRAMFGLGIIVLLLMPFAGGLGLMRTQKPLQQIGRGCLVIVSNLCFFLGLAELQMAEAVALFFVAPLLITALSVPLLGEKVGPRRWAAVAVGLVGVLVMLRPGMGLFQPAMLFPVIAALSYALVHMMTRRMAATESAATMTFYVQLCFIVVAGLMGLTVGDGRLDPGPDSPFGFLLRAWVWPDPGDWPVLLLIGIASTAGAYLMAQAYRLCEAGLAAPFEYANLPMAILLGLLIFGEWPDLVAWAGIFLIAGSGLYMFWREARAT